MQRTAGVSTTDVVGRMLLLTREHFRQGEREYEVSHESSSTMGLDSTARSPWTRCSQFLPTTSKIIHFSDGKEPKVLFTHKTFVVAYAYIFISNFLIFITYSLMTELSMWLEHLMYSM